jgi:dihydropteroate synthase
MIERSEYAGHSAQSSHSDLAAQWMAIVNLSPDSFSRDGLTAESLPARLDSLFPSQASIIDVGAVSTRPGSDAVSSTEEWKRLEQAWVTIESFKSRRQACGRPVQVSLDTSSPTVAERAARTGLVEIINDVYAGRRRENNRSTFDVARDHGCSLIVTHMPENVTPKDMQDSPGYQSCLDEVISFLETKVAEARSDGVKHVMIDPGIGFGKRLSDNLELLSGAAFRRYSSSLNPAFRATQVVIGLSRKRFLRELAIQSNAESMSLLEEPRERDGVTKIWEQKCIDLAFELQSQGQELQLIVRSHKIPGEIDYSQN